MKASVTLGITGFSLIAVTYGMARFSWGLMMPEVILDIPFSPRVAGYISACSFAAYCLAVVASSLLEDRFSSRFMAITSACCAAAGLAVVAVAWSPVMLAAGLFIAGLSPGLASPSLADAVNRVVTAKDQPQLNTLINSGTSAGIILSVPVLSFLPGGWRAACFAFALCALCCLPAVIRCLPRGQATARKNTPGWGKTLLQRPMLSLILIAFFSGIASAAWWNFGPDVLRHHVAVEASTVNLLWLVSGGAGIIGAITGPLAARIGLSQVYRLSQLAMAVPLVWLAFSHQMHWWLFAAVAFCGAGYVTLSGVLLVCGVSVAKSSPASGVAAVFFALAAGQVAGAVLFGLLSAGTGVVAALNVFAVISAALILLPLPQQQS